MKCTICFVFLIVSFFISSCDSGSGHDYDKGYEAAWNEESKPNRFSSKEYLKGYQQGLEDSDIYDDGYYDGYNKNKAKYPKDLDYMDGFKDGNKDRKY